MEFCPDCVSEMKPDKRRLGRGTKKWMVCINCGLRTGLDEEFSSTTPLSRENKELKPFEDEYDRYYS